MGHLNGILARVGGNLNKKFQKSQMPGGGMLKLRFDRYISSKFEFRYESLQIKFSVILFVYNLMIAFSKKSRGNYPGKCF